LKRLLKWVLGLALAGVLIGATIILVRAFDARSKPPLKPWHRPLAAEVRARDLRETTPLDDYLRREDAVFREMNEKVLPAAAPDDRTPANRYWTESPINPERYPKNWNRTFELSPEGELRGGALLVHGLTDAPYSVKADAEALRRQGYYTLCLRMPGHGTVPGGLVTARWEDWRAAVRVGARHVRRKIGEKAPFVLAGYSNGGALAVQYALDVAGGAPLPKPDRIVLFSPMIGVSPFASFARIVARVGSIPYFEQSRWLDILPEYIPFKYDSFPAFAAQQTAELTSEINEGVRKAAESGAIKNFPPVLAFVSLVDSTVETWATIDRLFDYLPVNESELVLFDLNRTEVVRAFLKKTYDAEVEALFGHSQRPYKLSLVTNAGSDTLEAVARNAGPNSAAVDVTPIGLSWPPGVFSLSHLAVPFAFDDPLFGIEPDMSVNYGLRLGVLAPRGERGVLDVSTDQFMRINCNPFFPYVEARMKAFVK
jgi:alpha-beta hydrolase superfamily lysophospholipase